MTDYPAESLPSHEVQAAFKEIMDNLPTGGLGFHGTSTILSSSILQHGLDPQLRVISFDGVNFTPSPQERIFYRIFNPLESAVDHAGNSFQALKERVSTGIGIGENVAKGNSGGGGRAEPLLVVFKDNDGRGERLHSHRYPTMAIGNVPLSNILGLYSKSHTEKEGAFVDRVIVDLAKKLSPHSNPAS